MEDILFCGSYKEITVLEICMLIFKNILLCIE